MTEEEAKGKICHLTLMGIGSSGLGRRCLGKGCMAFKEAEPEREHKPVGLEPEGEGWEKDGPPTGSPGGAVTHRQSWKRARYRCAAL